VNSSLVGTLLIAIAATLWATDSLFRVPAVQSVHPTFIVLFEHVIGVIVLLTWTCLRDRKRLLGHSFKSWLSLFFIGFGGSAFATVLFTASFLYINPSVAILIQKLQPIVVVLLAFLFLGEKPKTSFWGWALVAIVAALVVSFPGLDFHFLTHGIDLHSQGVIYALLAAVLWGAATVVGKSVSSNLAPVIVTFWRYFFGLIALLLLFYVGGESIPVAALHQTSTLRPLIYIAFFPGLTALLFYYSGLRRASAITATFTELLYPVSAVVLNWLFLGASLNIVQILGGIALLYSVFQISVLFA
jgi:drug/metabolite transporter (DMT)-like permease